MAEKTYIKLLKEMFEKQVLPKDASLIPVYYHKDFLLYANGKVMDYTKFFKDHKKYYATQIQYHVAYQDETFVEQGNKVAGRMFITTQQPGEDAKELEVILIVEYKDNKIYRLWELTYPDWSQLPAFKE